MARERRSGAESRIPQWLLALVLASAGLLVAAAALAPAPGDLPTPHPELPTLLVGGAATARSAALLAIGWAFGALQIALFALCFALGVRRAEGLGPLRRPLWIAATLYQAVWAALVIAYVGYARDPSGPLWGAFPAPTAWLFYGLWPYPLVFAWLYLHHFDAWVLGERDLERFRAALARARGGAGPGGGDA